MPAALPFTDRAGRTVSTTLTDHDLGRLDAIRMLDPDMPSRAELIRNAVLLMLDLHEDPAVAIDQLLTGLIDIYSGDRPDAEPNLNYASLIRMPEAGEPK